MAKNTFKIISLISIGASLLTVLLSIIIKRATWYSNDYSCIGTCGTFSILGLIFTVGGFILAIVLSVIAKKDQEITGKKIIKTAMILNLILFFLWFMNNFGIFIPAR
jgi:hypothetical protein